MTATALSARVHRLDAIICGEFNEMPGMRLTTAQVARLWALTASEAHAAVRSLVARGLLTLDDQGRVCRGIDLMA
jgi:DNA-binding IclR family transcriptional regulator